MTQDLDEKTKKILELKGLDLNDFSVEISIRQDTYSDENDEQLFINVSFYNHPESYEAFGSASYILYDAENIHVSDIRDMADNYSFDMYQAVSSVRIYYSEEAALIDESEGFPGLRNEDTHWLGLQDFARQTGIHIFSYEKGFEQGTFEGIQHDSETHSVWGKVLVLNEITIQEEYRANAIINNIFQNTLSVFKKTGLNWVIINPNINEEYMKEKNYPFYTQKNYNDFLSKIGFSKTHGRLHENKFCWCFGLQT